MFRKINKPPPDESVQLRLYSPIWDGNGGEYVEDVSPGKRRGLQAKNWLRSINHGPFIGSFELYDDEEVLADFFYSKLGFDFKETVGVDTWDGFVFEMELSIGGSIKRRSYEHIQNAVRTVHDIDISTAWVTNAQSIKRYGRREHIEYFSSPYTAALARTNSILARTAWPWPRQIGFEHKTDRPRLRVRVCGYWFTANFQFATVNNVGGNWWEVAASSVVEAIVTTDCPWLTVTKIDTNTLPVAARRDTATRAGEWIRQIAELGDNTQAVPWLARVEVGRKFVYERMPVTTPLYAWHGGQLVYGVGRGSVNPYLVTPGLVRDMNIFSTSVEPGSIFPDSRDSWIDEVEVGPGGLSVRSVGAEYTVLERQQQYAMSIGEEDADLLD